MSDNLRRYRAIREALTHCYPGEMSGRMAQHLTTLAAFISSIVGSKNSQLPSIATKIADRAKPESRVKRLSRWLDNKHIKEEVYFLPYAEILLNCLALETLVLVMDGSGVDRDRPCRDARAMLCTNDPRDLSRSCPAVGLGGASVPQGAFS